MAGPTAEFPAIRKVAGFLVTFLVLSIRCSLWPPAATAASTSTSASFAQTEPLVHHDTTPPSGSIVINAEAPATSNPSIALTLSATDDLGSVTLMRFSNDNVTYTSPQPYAPRSSWTLAAGDGTKTVYVQFADQAGNWSAPASDTILLDTTPPNIQITDPTDGAVIGIP